MEIETVNCPNKMVEFHEDQKKKLGHNYYDDQHQILDRLGLEDYNLFFILSSAYNVHVL